MFNPYKSSINIKEELVDYITTIFPFSNENLKNIFLDKLNQIVSKGPYLDIKPAFETKYSIDDLIKKNEMSYLFANLEKGKSNDEFHKVQIPLTRPLYTHQVEAVLKSKTKNLVVTTGTGSGKTECFLLPIINELLSEKEKTGIISNQVKVIIIYPMNALANDQLKRLRNILMYYPEITFGSYTGETEWKKDAAEKKYADLHENEGAEELKATSDHCGLINEIKSRAEMIAKPPHILITNYAMLERMLLVPENDALFRNADMKYIVLDEAHVYQGARGMETSLLIRRLLARINAQNVKFILTSATLGEKGKSEGDICVFASNLTGGNFDNDSIIYGKRVSNLASGLNKNIPVGFFVKAADYVDDENGFEYCCQEYEIDYDHSKQLRENIYDICYNSSLFGQLQSKYLSKQNLITSVSDLPSILGVSTVDEAISFIFVSSFGEKNKISLLDSRYHYFLRALEGCFISFSKKNNLFLQRKIFDESNYRVFELSICKKCGDMALYGTINEEGILVQNSGMYDNKKGFYFHFSSLLSNKTIEDEDLDELEEKEITDDDYKDKKGIHKISKYYLCPKCGMITIESDGKPKCQCNVSFLELYSTGTEYHGCLTCKGGVYNKFYIGNDAATGVIGTSLFEELPTKQVKGYEGGMEVYKEGGKQFLAFSDSRSEAAYFASYMDKTYEVFLRRRAITNVIEKNKNYFIDEPWTLDELASNISNLFYKEKTFKENVLEVGSHLKLESDRNAWYGILTEIVGQKKRNSLSSLGITCFEYAGVDDLTNYYLKHPVYGKKIDISLARPLLNEIVMTTAYWGAIEPDYNLTEEDRLFIFYSRRPKYITLKKDYTESDDAYITRNVSSWLPRPKKSKPGEYVNNSRYYLASKLLNSTDDNVIGKFLEDCFNYITKFIKIDYRMKVYLGNSYYFASNAFVVKSPVSTDVKWYKCKKCGKISNYSINGKCSIFGCDGDAKEVDLAQIYKDNHYRNMYSIKDFHKLFIKEHTAQISSDDASNYQSDFEKNKLNALSCSTTFEMGVDLGSLETVFMRDIPPSPSNYTQRSGRAGRSKDSSAYTLTYAKLSSHDFNYYNNPLGMINGKILPPKFKINNEKVVLRHIYAVVLSYLFQHNVVSMSTSVVLSDAGLKNVSDYLSLKKSNVELTDILANSFSGVDCAGFEPKEYDWLDKFIGPDGALTLLVNDFTDTLGNFDKLIEDDKNKISKEKGIKKLEQFNNDLKRHMNQRKGFANQRLIDALSRGNVLPKYGFPVDNAELDIGNESVNLSRDLSIAISEYAPGETVIANGMKYVSRYIKKKVVGKEKNKIFTERFFAICPDCETYNYSKVEVTDSDNKVCSGCGKPLASDKWEKSIIPDEGFYHDYKQIGQVSISSKPEKLYASEDCYVGDNKAIKETVYSLNKHNITLKHTENDEIMVVSRTAFYVCPACGYSYGVLDVIKDEKGKKDKAIPKQIALGTKKINVKSSHDNRFGHPCDCHDFFRNYLTHVYKTDVVQMSFDSLKADNHDVMLSVATALIDAISYLLDIERTDISGCINLSNNKYDIIVYDAVPGGAGHVKRLLDDTGKILSNVIETAMKKMKACSCGSSCYECLRSYYNQRYHDVLDRNHVINFLDDYIGPYSCVSQGANNPIIDNNFDNSQKKNNEDFEDIAKEAETFADEGEKEYYSKLLTLIATYPAEKPSYSNCSIIIDGKKYTILAKWNGLKVVLIDSKPLYNLIKDDSVYDIYLINDMSTINQLVSKIRRA